MKTLYVVRHAKAISGELGINDFKRSLSKQGQVEAKAMGKRLRKKGIAPELLISSPADRALETAQIFAGQFGYPLQNILLNDHIYDEGGEALREIVKQLDEGYNTVMLFGHEPSLSEFAKGLLKDTEIELRTTGVLGISLDISRWQAIDDNTGTLILFDFPVRATPKVYKKARKAIAQDITASMEELLEQIDSDASKHLNKVIEKTSKKLAKELTKVLRASKVEDLSGTRSQQRVDTLDTTQVRKVSPAEPGVPSEPVSPEPPIEQALTTEKKPVRMRRTQKPAAHDKSPEHEAATIQKQPRKRTTPKTTTTSLSPSQQEAGKTSRVGSKRQTRSTRTKKTPPSPSEGQNES